MLTVGDCRGTLLRVKRVIGFSDAKRAGANGGDLWKRGGLRRIDYFVVESLLVVESEAMALVCLRTFCAAPFSRHLGSGILESSIGACTIAAVPCGCSQVN
jgi:hypothetical protein